MCSAMKPRADARPEKSGAWEQVRKHTATLRRFSKAEAAASKPRKDDSTLQNIFAGGGRKKAVSSFLACDERRANGGTRAGVRVRAHRKSERAVVRPERPRDGSTDVERTLYVRVIT